MNCSSCGAPLAESDAFCGSCGNPVGVAAPAPSEPAPAAQPATPPPPPAPTDAPQYGMSPQEYGSAQPTPPPGQPPSPPQYGTPQYGTPPPPPYGAAPPYGAGPPPAYTPGYGAYGFQDPLTGAPTAEWWQRAVALIIDWFIIGIPSIILLVTVIAATATTSYNTSGVPVTTHSGAAQVLVYVIWILLYGSYYVLLNGSERGQTVGKMAMGIATRDEAGQGSIGYGRASGRFGIVFVCGFFCGIALLLDYLWPLWDPRRQAWHDKVARSLVVKIR